MLAVRLLALAGKAVGGTSLRDQPNTNPYNVNLDYAVPPARRMVLVVGGFPVDTASAVILNRLREIVSDRAAPVWVKEGNVQDVYCKGQFSTTGFIKFVNKDAM